MAHCGSLETCAKLQAQRQTTDISIRSPQAAVDQNIKPVLFEVYGEIWTVQSRLGQGVSASVYRVCSDRATSAAVKEFQADTQGGDYGFHKERSVFEDIHGHKNIGSAMSVGKSVTCFHCHMYSKSLFHSACGFPTRISVKWGIVSCFYEALMYLAV